MAAKQYIDLADLALFKQLNDSATAQAIATAEARSLHTVSIDGTTLNFYREEEPVGGATPAYSITLPQQDLSNYLQKIANATGSKVVLSKADGTIEESAYTVADLVLESEIAAVAKSGNADDVAYDNTDSGLTATDVQSALDELAEASSGGVASKTIWFRDSSAGQSDYAKVYNLYQGAFAPESQTDPAALVGTINIPKDLVVQSGSVVVNPTGQPAGTYIELIIQNQAEPLYINVADLVDDYTAAQGATQVQLAISSTNEISATLVDGGVSTAKIADDAVTAAKIDIAAHTEANAASAGADGLLVSVTTTDGQVSAVSASIAANTYEAYGTTSTAISALDAVADATKDGIDSQTDRTKVDTNGVLVLESITEVDGKITGYTTSEVAKIGVVDDAMTAHTIYGTRNYAYNLAQDITGTSSDTSTDLTLYGLRAYADEQAGDATESVDPDDIRALFNSPSV